MPSSHVTQATLLVPELVTWYQSTSSSETEMTHTQQQTLPSMQSLARQHVLGLGTASCHKICQTVELPVTYHSHCCYTTWVAIKANKTHRRHRDWRNHWKRFGVGLFVWFFSHFCISNSVTNLAAKTSPRTFTQQNAPPVLRRLAENTYCFPN